jgi:hypothetical protein
MVIEFLKFLFFKLIQLYNYFFNPYVCRVYSRSLTYTHSGEPDTVQDDPFWKNESRYWLNKGDDEVHWVPLKRQFITQFPENIKNPLFCMKYTYDRKKFQCFSRKPEVPSPTGDVKFSLPIKKVLLIECNRDITSKYLKRIGPKKDFHGEKDILFEELFSYDDYETVEIENLLGNKKTFSRTTALHQLI